MNTAKSETTTKMLIQTRQAERTTHHLPASASVAFHSLHLRTQRCQISPLPDAITPLKIIHSITLMFTICSGLYISMDQLVNASASDQPHSLETMLGFNAELGFTLTEWEDGYAKLEMELTEKHLNRSGILHGGVIATIIDAVGGYCGVWVPAGAEKKRALTLSLTTSFMGTTKEGRIYATAKPRRRALGILCQLRGLQPRWHSDRHGRRHL